MTLAMRTAPYFFVFIIFFFSMVQQSHAQQTIRLMTYNASLNREEAGELLRDMQRTDQVQIQRVAAVIQHLRPDVLVLQEFDYDKDGQSLALFLRNYLSVGQFGQKPIHYAYTYQPPTNTGLPTGLDLDGDGRADQPGDAYGFGKFPGQYGFVILSNLPIISNEIRTFQQFLWKDMPNANLPSLAETGQSYYSEDALRIFRLSSKNHVDVPLQVGDKKLHILAAHPTPPVFDGPEDRNGKRNHDEIRMLADYISGPKTSAYLVDDKGRKGGMDPREPFVIMGDLNADPNDGDSYQQAILQLFNHPRINGAVTRGSFVPSSKGGVANSQANERLQGHKGNPAHDTAFWGLRVDHVLPSMSLEIKGSGIFWPLAGEVGHEWIRDGAASDHLPVWVDVVVK